MKNRSYPTALLGASFAVVPARLWTNSYDSTTQYEPCSLFDDTREEIGEPIGEENGYPTADRDKTHGAALVMSGHA